MRERLKRNRTVINTLPTKLIRSNARLSSLYAPSFAFFTEHITLTMQRLQIDHYEFYTLMALLLWDFREICLCCLIILPASVVMTGSRLLLLVIRLV